MIKPRVKNHHLRLVLQRAKYSPSNDLGTTYVLTKWELANDWFVEIVKEMPNLQERTKKTNKCPKFEGLIWYQFEDCLDLYVLFERWSRDPHRPSRIPLRFLMTNFCSKLIWASLLMEINQARPAFHTSFVPLSGSKISLKLINDDQRVGNHFGICWA